MSSSHHLPAPRHAVHATAPLPRKTRLILGLILVTFILMTIAGAVSYWPESTKHKTPDALGPPPRLVDGKVDQVQIGPCEGDPSSNRCATVEVAITSGPDTGQHTTLHLQQGPGQPELHAKDEIVLGRATDISGDVSYYFSDFERKAPLAWLGLAFAVLVVLVGRLRGVGALAGLGFTWFAVTQFLLPSLLEGNSPVGVALTTSAAIVLVVLYVAHGLNAKTTTAIIGTLISLAVTATFAWMALKVAHITGLSSEETLYVQTYAGTININGLLLAGIIIGSLGVLNDMTVTQASAVWEIHLAQPMRSIRGLYRSGMRVGRDHIASTVYTLVLAYTGAALPLLVLFTLANREVGQVFSSDVVSEEIVRTLVGAIGLVSSVPITTSLAAFVAKSQPSSSSSLTMVVQTSTAELGERAELEEPAEPEEEVTETAEMKKVRKRIRLPRRRVPSFEEARKMSRRERKFWAEK